MKQYLFSFLMLFACVTASAQSFNYTYEGHTLKYTILDDVTKTCSVSRGSEKINSPLVIPAQVQNEGTDYTVTTIGTIGSGFAPYTSGMTSVTIPNSVTTIGKNAFSSCRDLTSVTLPNSVTSIGERAFSGCSSLISIYSLNTTPPTCFSNSFYDYQTTTLYVPGSALETYRTADVWKDFESIVDVDKVFDYTHEGQTLRYMIIDDAAKTCSVFNVDRNITEAVVVPAKAQHKGTDYSVTVIGASAFYKCSGLTLIDIPNSVTAIGASAFYECSGLTSIDIPNSVTDIGEETFFGCSGLTSVALPNSLTSIGASIFKGCTSLTSIDIPNSVTTIGASAFSGCFGLTSVTLPNSVTTIGDYAFQSCN